MLAAVRALIGRFVSSGRTAGAGVTIASGGRTVLEHRDGLARPSLAVGPETVWPLASISKLYTAAAIVRLIELGELTLSMRVRSVLPRFDGGGKEEATLRQLLTHTAGLVYEPPDMPELLTRQARLSEIVNAAYELPLMFRPGTQQSYSDLGFAMAGRLAAADMRAEFHALVRDLVLHPANLTNT